MGVKVIQSITFSTVSVTGFLISLISYRLYRIYRMPYQFSFMMYIIFWNILGLIGYIYINIVPEVVRGSELQLVFLVVTPLFIPLHGIISYFFIDFVFQLMDKLVPRLIKIGVSFIYLFFFIFELIKNIFSLNPYSSNSPSSIFPFSFLILIICFLGSLIFLTIGLKKCRIILNRHFLYYLILTLSAGFGITSYLMLFSNLIYLVIIFFFLFNVPVLYFLYRYSKTAHDSYPLTKINEINLVSFCSKFGITKREREILELVIKGKSNKQIEAELFISIGTVKNYIYKMYQKLGIKSRLQLNYILQNHIKK
jgi:DNA-binding CsgD family transcriptional regulator